MDEKLLDEQPDTSKDERQPIEPEGNTVSGNAVHVQEIAPQAGTFSEIRITLFSKV